MSPEFDDEERSGVHLMVDRLLANTKVTTVKLPPKPVIDPKARTFYGKVKTEEGNPDRSPMSDMHVTRIHAQPEEWTDPLPIATHDWKTISSGKPLRRRCTVCMCISTVYQTGPATYQLPGDDVTTRVPECKP